MAQIIKPIAAEDEAGVKVEPLALASSLRRLHCDGWYGREVALDEISEIGYEIIDWETLTEQPDPVVASYLMMARCESHPDLPTVTLAEAEIVPA